MAEEESWSGWNHEKEQARTKEELEVRQYYENNEVGRYSVDVEEQVHWVELELEAVTRENMGEEYRWTTLAERDEGFSEGRRTRRKCCVRHT